MNLFLVLFIMRLSKERGAIDMVVRLNPVDFAKARMKRKEQLIPTVIVLNNGIAGIVYGYYVGENFYYLDRLDVDVSKKEELRKINAMELRQEIAEKIKIFVANSN